MQSIGKSLKSGYKICEPDFYENNTRELDKLMLQVNFGRPEKADRGSFLHNYHRPYSKIFHKDMRYKVQNVLEIVKVITIVIFIMSIEKTPRGL